MARDVEPVSAEQVVPSETGTPPDDETIGEALHLLLHGLEQRAEQGLASLLEVGLRALFSKSMRDLVEREVRQILHEGVTRALQSAPDGTVVEAVETQVGQIVQAILPEILESIFGGPIGEEIERHGQQAIEAVILRKDVDAAQEDGKEVLSEALDGVLEIIQRHKRDVLVATVRVLTTVSEQVVTDKMGEGVQSIAGASKHVVEEPGKALQQKGKDAAALVAGREDEHARSGRNRARAMKGKGKDLGSDLGAQLVEAGDMLRQRVMEEADNLKGHLGEELKSALKAGQSSKNFGRPPSAGRSPGKTGFGHPPSTRAPSGRPSPARRPAR